MITISKSSFCFLTIILEEVISNMITCFYNLKQLQHNLNYNFVALIGWIYINIGLVF